MIEKYRPSNGTEGMDFIDVFCDQCIHDDPENNVYCDILSKTLIFKINDPQYPDEWQYNENGEPVCTAFKSKLRG